MGSLRRSSGLASTPIRRSSWRAKQLWIGETLEQSLRGHCQRWPGIFFSAFGSLTQWDQIAKIRQKIRWKKIVNLTGHTYVCKQWPETEVKWICWNLLEKLFVKSHQVNLFLAGFSHLEPPGLSFVLWSGGLFKAFFLLAQLSVLFFLSRVFLCIEKKEKKWKKGSN